MKAKLEEPVREAALCFLETGAMPFRFAISATHSSATAPVKLSRRKQRVGVRKVVPESAAAAPDRVTIDPRWPLPVPEYLIPLVSQPSPYDRGPRPRLDVLLELAIEANLPEEVLRWFDRMRAEATRPSDRLSVAPYADRVAEAVSSVYPERTIDIYRAEPRS